MLRTRAKAACSTRFPHDHDVTDEIAAYKLADEPFPGYFGIFYKVNKPTKNAKEAEDQCKLRRKRSRA